MEKTFMSEYELEQSYKQMLDDAYGEVDVVTGTYDTSKILREVDPIAYRVGMADYADSLMRDDESLEIEGYTS